MDSTQLSLNKVAEVQNAIQTLDINRRPRGLDALLELKT